MSASAKNVLEHSNHRKICEAQAAAKNAGVSWCTLYESVTNEMLREVLFPNMASAAEIHVMPDLSYIHRELACSGVSLTLNLTEYSAKCNAEGRKPYQYTQFYEKYRQWAQVTKATMSI